MESDENALSGEFSVVNIHSEDIRDKYSKSSYITSVFLSLLQTTPDSNNEIFTLKYKKAGVSFCIKILTTNNGISGSSTEKTKGKYIVENIRMWIAKTLGNVILERDVISIKIIEKTFKENHVFVKIRVSNAAIIEIFKTALKTGCQDCGKLYKRLSCKNWICRSTDFELYNERKDACKTFTTGTGIRIGHVVSIDCKKLGRYDGSCKVKTFDKHSISIIEDSISTQIDYISSALHVCTLDVSTNMFGGLDVATPVQYIYAKIEKGGATTDYCFERINGTASLKEKDILICLNDMLCKNRIDIIFTCKDPNALLWYIKHRMTVNGISPLTRIVCTSSYTDKNNVLFSKGANDKYIKYPISINIYHTPDGRKKLLTLVAGVADCLLSPVSPSPPPSSSSSSSSSSSPSNCEITCNKRTTVLRRQKSEQPIELLLSFSTEEKHDIIRLLFKCCLVTGNGMGESMNILKKKPLDVDILASGYKNGEYIFKSCNYSKKEIYDSLIDEKTGYLNEDTPSFKGGTIERFSCGYHSIRLNRKYKQYGNFHKLRVVIVDYNSSYSNILEAIHKKKNTLYIVENVKESTGMDMDREKVYKNSSFSHVRDMLSHAINCVNHDMKILKDKPDGHTKIIAKSVTNTSIYGKKGDVRSPYYFLDEASRIAEIGRDMLEYLKSLFYYYFVNSMHDSSCLLPSINTVEGIVEMIAAEKKKVRDDSKESITANLIATQTDSIIFSTNADEKCVGEFARYVNESLHGVSTVSYKSYDTFINFEENGSYIAVETSSGSVVHSGSFLKKKTTPVGCSTIYAEYLERILGIKSAECIEKTKKLIDDTTIDGIRARMEKMPPAHFCELVTVSSKLLNTLKTAQSWQHAITGRNAAIKQYNQTKVLYDGCLILILKCVVQPSTIDGSGTSRRIDVVFDPEDSSELPAGISIDYEHYATSVKREIERFSYMFTNTGTEQNGCRNKENINTSNLSTKDIGNTLRLTNVSGGSKRDTRSIHMEHFNAQKNAIFGDDI